MARRAHADIARFLRHSHRLTPWWSQSQSVTMPFDKATGLRQRGEKRDGFAVSKSRTLSVPLVDAYAAWVDAIRESRGSTIRTWSPNCTRSARRPFHVEGRTQHRGRELRAEGCCAHAGFIQHERLPSTAAAEHMRGYWSRQLDRLVAEIG